MDEEQCRRTPSDCDVDEPPDVAAVDVDGLVSEVLGDDVCLDGLSARELTAVLQQLEIRQRRTHAALTAVVDHADRMGAYGDDGHASIRGWTKASNRWSDTQATTHKKVMRLCRDMEVIRREYRAGRLGLAQVTELARLYANPRCGHLLVNAESLLVEDAQKMDYESFRTVAKRWESLADMDGADQDAELGHESRNACCITDTDGRVHLDAHLAGAQGLIIKNVFDRFLEAETLADWEAARAVHGEAATRSDLPRTDEQRRADALVAVFRRAASMPPDAKSPEPLVNILCDLDTFERLLARAAGDETVDPPDPAEYRQRRMETTTGAVVAPSDIVAAALTGHIRRVVIESPSNVIDLGRRCRLFTGSAREAAKLWHPRCIYPGCGVPTEYSQVDHVESWHAGGVTAPSNGRPGCGRHNRWKETGFRSWEDFGGYWHTIRPDGTEIMAV